VSITSVSLSNAQFDQEHNCNGRTRAERDLLDRRGLHAERHRRPAQRLHSRHRTLSIVSNAPGSPHSIALSGAAEKSLITHYYRSILRRAPDAGGKAFWSAEAGRVADLGVDVNEAWFAMAQAFFFSAEFAAFNRTNRDTSPTST
jgi:hypothetical protein